MSILAANNMLLGKQSIVVPYGLVFYSPMRNQDIVWGDVGSEIKERSGAGLDGATTNLDASNVVSAPFNNALDLNGIDEYINYGAFNPAGMTEFTIGFWIAATTDQGSTVIPYRQWNAGSQSWFLSSSATGGNTGISAAFKDTLGNTTAITTFSLDIQERPIIHDGVMRCIFVQWSGNTIEVYRNDYLCPQNYDSQQSPGALVSTTEDLVAGARWNAGTPDLFMKAQFGECRIYNRLLTAQERAELVAQGA